LLGVEDFWIREDILHEQAGAENRSVLKDSGPAYAGFALGTLLD
jgi:hypothetical protein